MELKGKAPNQRLRVNDVILLGRDDQQSEVRHYSGGFYFSFMRSVFPFLLTELFIGSHTSRGYKFRKR